MSVEFAELNEFNFSKDFIAEGIKKANPRPRKRGGRYTKRQKIARQQQVLELYVQRGYSVSKIAELLQVNRNTISNDIKKIDEDLTIQYEKGYASTFVMKQIHRMEVSRSRLIDELEKQTDIKIKLVIEKQVFEIEKWIAATVSRVNNLNQEVIARSTDMANSMAEEYNIHLRWLSPTEALVVTKETYEKINAIIKKDKIQGGSNNPR